jgi:hypothetical protein
MGTREDVLKKDPQYPTTAILGTVLLVPAQEHATTVECGQEVLQYVAKVVTVPQPHEMGSPVSVLEVDSLCPITVIQDTA